MSFNLRDIREVSDEPLTKFVSHLAYRIQKLAMEQQTQELENKEDIYSNGQDVDTVLRFHSLTSTKIFDFSLPFYPPLEPDLDKNTIWLQGHNMGNSTRDLSCFNNNNWISGDPIIIDGSPFDYGIHTGGTKSLALRFNRVDGSGLDHETVYREHIGISHDTRIILDGSSSMTWFFRVRPLSTGLDEGKRRTIYLKCDQTGTTNSDIIDAVRFSIDNINKRLVIQIKRSSTFYSKETAINKFTANNVYDCFITFNAGTIHCYLSKTGDTSMTDETLSTSSYTEEWGPDLSNREARLFKRGPGANDGAFHGDFYDFKIYRNYTVSQTDANRHRINKWSISDIPFGQVMITDYYSTYREDTGTHGYDSTGYDSTGYDT